MKEQIDIEGLRVLRDVITELYDCQIPDPPISMERQGFILVADEFLEMLFSSLNKTLEHELSFLEKSRLLEKWVVDCKEEGYNVCFCLDSLPVSVLLPVGAAVMKRPSNGTMLRPLW